MNQTIRKEQVGFLGLGKLGAPIANNLVNMGIPLTVWNRTPSKAGPLGPASAKGRIRPLLGAMGAERVVDFGEEIGAGSATKLVGNFLIISGFVALQEAFDVLSGSGIDPKSTLEMLTTTLVATTGNQRYTAALLSGKVPPRRFPPRTLGSFGALQKRRTNPRRCPSGCSSY